MTTAAPVTTAGGHAERLRGRLATREASVVVVGQGYVGLSVLCGAATAGLRATGLDVDAGRVDALGSGDLVVPGVDPEGFAAARRTGRTTFATDPAVVADADVVLLCLPTPVEDHRPDLRPVEDAVRAVAPHVRPGTLVVLESTTYPGTTEQVVRPLLEAGSGLDAAADLLLAYSPERIDPGNVRFGLRSTPRVVGGLTLDALRAASAFYGLLVDEVVVVSSCRAAELTKLHENTFRMVNIALVNELAGLCHEQGLDVWEVVRAASSKPFGFMPFLPGPGVGGHCIPLDPTYLAWQSRRDTGRPFRLVEMAQDINAAMPRYVADRVHEALDDRGLPLRGTHVHALGITYKPDVGDLRESAAVRVLEVLDRRGARVTFHDPYVERLELGGRVLLRDDDPTTTASADVVLLLTPHTSYDLDDVESRARLLFDARDALGRRGSDRVVTL